MDVKDTIAGTVTGARERLTALSHRLHAHPEVAWAEERAAAWVGAELADAGFAVETNACGLPTAFIARTGTGPLHVGICAEYDALPALGHACGHNIIAAAAVGAGLALAATAGDLGLTVTVFGTPAEEGGGGKVYMLERGAFDGVHAAMMVHPGPVDVAEARPFAVSHMLVRYRGQATHAAAYPDRGVNAADAFTIAQVAIGLLRQQLLPSTRVHGIVTHGGDAPNAIPDRTEGRWYVRAETLAELAGLEPRVRRCFEAGALATGCELEIEAEAPPYAEFRNDPDLLPLYRANAERLGRQFAPAGPDGRGRTRWFRRRCSRADEPRFHRHGQRLAGGPGDPPLHRDRVAAGGQPPEGIRRALRHARRRSGPRRRGHRPGLDGRGRGPRRGDPRAAARGRPLRPGGSPRRYPAGVPGCPPPGRPVTGAASGCERLRAGGDRVKIGLQIPDFTWPGGAEQLGPTLATIARTADDAGFAHIMVMDHFFQIRTVGPPEHEMLEAYTALGFLAAHTSRARLGTLVTGAIYRYAGILAKTVTTLDVLSGGRAWLGIGAGWNEQESRGLGIRFPPMAERFEQLEETIQICLQMWAGDETPYHGKLNHLERPLNSPQALTKPHPPIMIGGGGEKKTLRLVAKYAQACNLFPGPELGRKLDVLREHCEREGRDYDEIEKTAIFRFDVGPKGEKAGEVIDQLGQLAETGIQTVIGGVHDVAQITPLEVIGSEVIPAVASLGS